MPPEARLLTADDLRAGQVAEFEREVTEADVLGFAENSGDHNPLHVDAGYAAGTRFGRRIVHGAFQVGLASALIGMYLPGRRVLLGSIHARFPAPLTFPCRVLVRGELTAWDRRSLSGRIRVTVVEQSRRVPTAEVTLGVSLLEGGEAAASPARPEGAAAGPASGRQVVLVTGASGGIGAEVVARLAAEYRVLAVSHSNRLGDHLRSLDAVRELNLDLGAPHLEDEVRDALGGAPLYGVVHAAWPGAPRGGLLQAQDEVIEQQVGFGALSTVRLARCLFNLSGGGGGRFVAVGSVVGSMQPSLTLAAYSLGKAVLEGSLKLLAPELARKQITVNAVCPTLVPLGMNGNVSDPQRKLEASRVPLGRLCTPADVVAAVRHLLGPDAAFLSGQMIGLTGGQLF